MLMEAIGSKKYFWPITCFPSFTTNGFKLRPSSFLIMRWFLKFYVGFNLPQQFRR